MNDPFSAISKALPSSTRVFGFRGTEALSTLYRFELYLFVEDPGFDMGAAVGADTTLLLHREDGHAPIRFHGIIAGIKTVGDLVHGALYRAVLVPRLHKLTLTQHSRVFVSRSMPEILEEVLTLSGLERGTDFVFRLSERYAPFEHVCQYRESNFAFLSRRMEREGVYYFLEQEEERERLVVTDNLSFHRPFWPEPVRWVQVTGTASKGGNGIRTFACEHTSIPGRVRVQDYDYLKPALDVSGEAPASGWEEQIFLHAENAVSPEDSRRLARLRAEELLARRVVFQGAGRGAVFLRTGYTFEVEDHPRFDGRYLATEIRHRGKHGGLGQGTWELMGLAADGHDDDVTYHFDVTAIPAEVQYRPARATPVPRIYGLEKAVVDGEANHHYAQLDEHGRYLVKIIFDESPLKDGKASTRIRMMQPHAGNPESFHFPLRKGTEVFLSFDGGDPDRPFIAGVVPNTFKPTRVTSANFTKNVLETGGRNRILVEDLEDYQYVRISSPVHNTFLHLGSPNDSHNKISFTGGNALSATGFDSETSVGLSRLTVIGDFFYAPYLDSTYIANPGQGTIAQGQSKATSVNVGSVIPSGDQALPIPLPHPNDPTAPGTAVHGSSPGDNFADPVMREARDISPAAFDDPSTTGANPPAPVTEGDLTLNPVGMFRDPDGRSSYRVGSDLKYVRGDNVTKTEGDDLKVVLGDEKKHVHGGNTTHIDSGQLAVVVPTHTTVDILKTALYVSQFSFGVTNVSVSVFSTTQSAFYLKNLGMEVSKVLMKIIH
jgi:type VI secretion system secreted protein VgrG